MYPKRPSIIFPAVGQKFTAQHEKTGTMYSITVGSQYRLLMHAWFAEHSEIRPGDTITFLKNNGTISLKLTAKDISQAVDMFARKKGGLSIFEGKVFDLVIQALADIENGGINAVVRVNETGISIEWGNNIKSTKIILGTTEVSPPT